jgi:hypothetical protein
MARSAKTTVEPVHDLESLALPPMPPKILESYKRMWRDPQLFDDLEVGDGGLWVAMHGEQIVASGPELSTVLRMVDDYGPEDIIMLHLPADDVIEIH